MVEDVDYEDVLEGTVDEVKDAIKDLEDPDYEALLEAEKAGKDRKTVREFIESRVPDEDEEESEEEVLDEEEEEIVEEIEEETSGGLLASYSGSTVLVAGLILGVLIGFVAAGVSGVADEVTETTADPDLVRDSVATIAGVGLDEQPEVSEPEIRHGMYHMVVTSTIQTENETVDQEQQVYVTRDGEQMFLVQEQMGQTVMPIDIQEAVAQAEAADQQEDIPEDAVEPAPEEDGEELPDDIEEEVTVE